MFTKILQEIKFSQQITLIFLSILLFAIALGINAVSFPALLDQHHVDATHIGIAFTLDCLGGVVMSLFLSRIVAKMKTLRAMKVAATSYAAIILIIYFYQNFAWWAILAFVMGNLWFMYVITRQAVLNILLTSKQRSIGVGIFSMMISSGIALGPVIVKFSGAQSYFTFVISALFTLASFVCLLPLKQLAQPKINSQRISLIEFFKTNPRVFLGRFFLELNSYALMSFSVIFGTKINLTYEAAGLLISAYMASSFFDLIVGFLLKKYSPYHLINFGFLGGLICFIAVIFSRNFYALLTIYFCYGICAAFVYVSAMKVCNESFASEKLVAANATFQLIGSLGSLFGSLIGGILINIFSEVGFPITIILSSILYLSFLVIYEKTQKKFIS